MFLRPPRDLLPLLRRALLCWIVAALAVQGCTSALVQMLGPSHRHASTGQAAQPGLLERVEGAFREIRAWRAELRQQWLPDEGPHAHAGGVVHTHGREPAASERTAMEAEHPHAHTHAAFQRHHHTQDDPTVIAVDGHAGDAAADAAAQAGSGSVTLPLALAVDWAMPPLPWRLMSWPLSSTDRWADAPARASERPPRA
jgi:hypothetical protein